jgi:aminopeptidase-like protein
LADVLAFPGTHPAKRPGSIMPKSQDGIDDAVQGSEMHAFISELYPICRSITGEGVRSTLRLIQERIPLAVHEVPSGTPVFDWTVPPEWNIRDACIKNLQGDRIVDFRTSNLHVVSYSQPVAQRLPLSELKAHLHSLPDHPEWIPYRTAYYKKSWGFCLSHNQLLALADPEYDVCIEASLADGHLTYGEYCLPGEIQDEVLVSVHVCHPSLCNDNLSGIAVATFLADWLQSQPRRYSYRFLFIPATIGSITWLSRNQHQVSRIRHGLVLAGLADAGPYTYKKSRQGDADIDRVMAHVLEHSGQAYSVVDFTPYGYDERQYCSPGFDLAVGCFSRTPYSQYPEYHTSADDLNFVKPQSLAQSLRRCQEAVDILERNRRFVSQNPHCEPQLGKRGLYRFIGGQAGEKEMEMAILWTLNLSDGRHSLLDIAVRAKLPFARIHAAAAALVQTDLLKECPAPQRTLREDRS